jgi:flagellar basal body-associated protein FliL
VPPAATTAILGVVMIVIALAVIMAAIGIVFMRGTAPLQPAENHEEKPDQQDKDEDDERFHV